MLGILNLRKWGLYVGCKKNCWKKRIWILLKNPPLIYMEVGVLKCILMKLDSILQRNHLSSPDHSAIELEIEVNTPYVMPYIPKLFINEYYYEVLTRRYISDSYRGIIVNACKNVMYVRGINGRLKT